MLKVSWCSFSIPNRTCKEFTWEIIKCPYFNFHTRLMAVVFRREVAEAPRTIDPSKLSRNEFLVFRASPDAYESTFPMKSWLSNLIIRDQSALITRKLFWRRSSECLTERRYHLLT